MKKFGITILHAQSFFFTPRTWKKCVSTPAQAACTYQGPEIDKNDSLICFGGVIYHFLSFFTIIDFWR